MDTCTAQLGNISVGNVCDVVEICIYKFNYFDCDSLNKRGWTTVILIS